MRLFVALLLLVIPVVADAKFLMPPLSDNFLPIVIEEPKKEPVKEEKPEDVVWLIDWYSKIYKVNWTLAKKIAWCESWFRNVKNKHSSATWPFQIIRATFASNNKKYLWWKWDVWNIDNNVHIWILILRDQWTRPRNASKYCWNKK